MGDKIRQIWNYIQDLLDVRGDVIMMAMSTIFIVRVGMSAFGYPPLNASEAALYSAAIASFAYSNKGTPKT